MADPVAGGAAPITPAAPVTKTEAPAPKPRPGQHVNTKLPDRSKPAEPAKPVEPGTADPSKSKLPAPKDSKPEAPTAPVVNKDALPKHKVKIGDKEEEVTLDDLVANYQKGTVAEQKFREAAALRDEVEKSRLTEEKIKAQLKTDPRSAFRLIASLGLDPKQVAAQYMLEQWQDSQMTPEQRQQRDNNKRLQALEQQEIQRQAILKQVQQNNLNAAEKERLTKEITAALTEQGMPQDPTTMARVTYYMAMAKKQGVTMPANKAVEFAREKIIESVRQQLDATPEESLDKFLSPALQEKLRKKALDAYNKKVGFPTGQAPTTNGSKAPANEGTGRTVSDFLDALRGH